MMVRKFPVTAPSGRQYEVEIRNYDMCYGIYVYSFAVFKYVERRNIFGRVRTRRVLVNEKSYPEERVEDFIEVAEKAVMEYEESISAYDRRESALAAFEAWDGVIKAEVGA